MDQYQDSALQLLETINQPENLAEEFYAYYIVRMTQAKSKTDKVHTSDSLIKNAIIYYEKQRKDSILWADAYRYCGRINDDRGKTNTAIAYFNKTLNVAPSIILPFVKISFIRLHTTDPLIGSILATLVRVHYLGLSITLNSLFENLHRNISIKTVAQHSNRQ